MSARPAIEDILPLTPLQEGLLFQSALDADGPDVYTVQLALTLDGPLHAADLRAAAAALLKRHANLRAAFRKRRNGETVAIVARDVALEWEEVDLGADGDGEPGGGETSDLGADGDGEPGGGETSDLGADETSNLGTRDASERVARLDELCRAERARRFDVARPPLLRFLLVRLRPDRHTLVLTHHHVLLDGWSTPLLGRELFALYAAGGDATALTPVTPYRDYLAWLKAQDKDTARAAWAEALAGAGEPTRIAPPAVGARAPLAPSRVDLRLPAATTARLTELARARGLTLNTIVQGAWGVLLARLLGRDDVVFGTTVSGRPAELPGIESMIGLFINTVAVRVRLAPAEPIAAALARLQDEQAALLAHQHLGLGEVQALAGSGELFDTLAVFESYPFDPAGVEEPAPGLRLVAVEGSDATHYPLGLTVFPGDEIELQLNYRPDCFEHAEVQRIGARLVTLFEAICADPDQPLGRLGVLDRDELDELLETFNDAGEIGELAQRGDTLPALLDEVMRRRPDAEAVVCEDETLTWAQLGARTSRLARLLMARGVGPERTVGVALPRSVDLVVALLAVLRAGGAYLPLEPDHPDDRLAYTLADARPACVLTTRELAARLTTLRPTSACVALDDAEFVAELAAADPTPVADAERAAPLRTHNAAYVIYTSGSTGRPKGVVVTHEGVSKLLATQIDRAAVTADSRVSHFASVSFDLAFWELCQAMLSGGTLVVVPSERRFPGAALTDYLHEHRITVAALPPSLLADLPAELDLPKPLTLIVGGEAVGPALVQRFAAGRMMLNCYGPTEATVQSTIGLCDPDRRDGAVPIGRPDPGVRAYVLDDGLLPTPVGVAGELYLGGAGLARGYLRRPDLSCERFVADPHGPAGGRMYRTGDRARWDADGQLHFLGRADDQLQLRGFRIEPGEIVSALTSHPDVDDAAVVARRLDGDEDAGAPDQLVAFVAAPAPGPRPGATDLRRHLAQLLPAHMVPAAYVVLERLPALPGGKLDRRALATLALGDADLATTAGGRRPRSPREETLCELYAEVLGVSAVGIDDDFFELGGHSLLVTRLVSRIRSALGAELTLRAVFDSPTVARLAGRLDDRAGRAPLRAGPRPETLALSFAQQRLWFLYRLDGASATYNIPLALRLRGALDVEALRGAVDDLVARHETLRTVFPEHDGTPHQQILAPEEAARRGAALDPDVVRTDEAGLPELLRAAVRHPFELDAEPPLRARLFELGPDEHVLALAMHHIAGDGWSVLPLQRDLRAAYAARRARAGASAGAQPAWPRLPVQYADFALWQRELMGRHDDPRSLISRDAAYWAEALADLPEELALPTDRPRPAVSSRVGGAVELTLPPELHRSLRTLARGCEASVFMVLQSALAALLTRVGAGTDVPIGSPIAGRTDDAVDELVGFFVNTLVLRTDTSGDPTFRALVARVRDFDLSAYDHQDVPFERLVEALNPTRSLARHPLFQVMLAFQQTPELSFDLDGLDGRPERVDAGAAKFDLAFDVLEQHGVDGLDVLVEYSTDLFDEATARDLADRFARLLAAACAAPDVPIGRLDLLAPGEREQVVQDWGSAPLEAPAGTIPGLFEQQVARTPDAIALLCGDIELSFAQVDARASALAARLAARGVGPERIVALLLPRGVDAVICLLAVMKAGGAYLPLDPGYPPERIARTLADARPALAITTDALAPLLTPASDPSAALTLAPDPCAATTPAPASLPLLTLDDFDWSPPSDPAPLAAGRPQHPAYVIYTSGSTGEPKGVVVSHASIVNLFHSHRETLYRPTVAAAGGRALRVAHGWSFAFDASWQPQLWMLDGHALHIVVEEQLRDPALLVALLREQHIDFVEVTPSHAVALAASGLFAGGDCGLLALGVGGEAVPPSLWSEIRALPATEGYNLYGPTECTVDALAARIGDSERPLIGRPTSNARAYVLDAGLRPVAPHVVGELYIGGDALARGYLGQAVATSERFVADPYGAPGARMYRSGDLVRWTRDGRLDFAGRADDQVKIRGFRIELGEITAVLARHDAVAQAAVDVHERAPGDRRIVAYVVPADAEAGELDVARLRAHVGEQLPDYMMPAAFVTLDVLPMTVHGKLDRRALPVPGDDAWPARAAGRPPRDALEATLCDVLAETLGLAEPGGIDDDFFELGGHSLLLVRLRSRIADATGHDVRIATLFQHPTVAGLAAQLRDGPEPPDPAPQPPTPSPAVSSG